MVQEFMADELLRGPSTTFVASDEPRSGGQIYSDSKRLSEILVEVEDFFERGHAVVGVGAEAVEEGGHVLLPAGVYG